MPESISMGRITTQASEISELGASCRSDCQASVVGVTKTEHKAKIDASFSLSEEKG